jgi:hypothetical protein
MNAEFFRNNKLEIEGLYTPKTITKRLNIKITTKLIQIKNSNSVKVNARFQNEM